jgi:hypothetical protein
MKTLKKPRADSKLKNLPHADQETLWLLMHPTDRDTPAYTLEACACHVMLEHGFEPSLSSLSEWRSWFALARRIESAAERSAQVRMELAKDSTITPDDLERIAQTVFTAETLQDSNIKGYVALAKLNLQRRTLDMDARRLKLLEDKAAQADAAKDVLGTTMSPEEQTRRLREILK